MKSAGYEGTADLWELISMVRAAQTALRCVALYRVSPMGLIRKAVQGDRQAVLDVIKVDTLFLMDSCTRTELENALLAADKPFLDQVARAIEYRRQFGRRDACRIYLWFLFAIDIEMPRLDRLRETLDPKGSIFPGTYTFDKVYELCGKGRLAQQD